MKIRNFRLAVGVSCLLQFGAAASGSAQPEVKDSWKESSPAGIYQSHCAACHGEKGEGGKASPLDSTGHAWHHPDGQLLLWIQHGRYGPAMKMPGFGEALTPSETCGLIALMKTWWNLSQRQSQSKTSRSFAGQPACKE